MALMFGAVLMNRATRLEGAVGTAAGPMLRRGVREFAAPLGPEAAVAAVVDLGAELVQAASDGPVASVALAVEGAEDDGVIVDLGPVPGWAGFPLRARLAEALGVPAACLTTTQAAMLAEWQLGAAQHTGSVMYVAIGRTITAAVGFNGELLRRPFLGNIGHLPVMVGGPRCGCGLQGHLEAVASSQALVRRMIGLMVEAPATEALAMRLSGGRAEALQAPQIWQMAQEGDPVARALMDEANDALARTVLFLLLTLDTECLILGGPLAHAGPTWLAEMQARVAALAPPARSASLAGRLCTEAVGTVAALPGAVVLAQRQANAPSVTMKQESEHTARQETRSDGGPG